ncbi:UNVERIFIED_CONTAM: hypothetical protein Scaly_0837800 [Sesamum calycinum]|uniref:Uncharacterized protein n=1 Tax=Sesamum calycinum TaxID=2727403 RepID=A0AAW2RAE0_9LAMI
MADLEFSDDEDETTLRGRIRSQVLPEFVTVEIKTSTTDRAETSSQRRIGFQVPPEPEIVEVETSTTDPAETSSQRRNGFQAPPEPEIVEVETSITDHVETSSQRRVGFQVPPEPEIVEEGTSNDRGYETSRRRQAWLRRIQKVPPLLLKEKKNTEDYIPAVVSLGPYHHGKPELSLAEGFKPKALDLFVMGGRQNLEFYYDKVLEVVGEIRNCYERRSVEAYSDHELARMVLLDACFIINHIEISIPEADMYRPQMPALKEHKGMTMVQHLGPLTCANVLRDMFLLENQIPFRVVKLLMNLRYGNNEGEMLLNRLVFESYFCLKVLS